MHYAELPNENGDGVENPDAKDIGTEGIIAEGHNVDRSCEDVCESIEASDELLTRD